MSDHFRQKWRCFCSSPFWCINGFTGISYRSMCDSGAAAPLEDSQSSGRFRKSCTTGESHPQSMLSYNFREGKPCEPPPLHKGVLLAWSHPNLHVIMLLLKLAWPCVTQRLNDTPKGKCPSPRVTPCWSWWNSSKCLLFSLAWFSWHFASFSPARTTGPRMVLLPAPLSPG